MQTSTRQHETSILAHATAVALLALSGCSDNATIPDKANEKPIADARLLVDGMPIDQLSDGGTELLVIPLENGATSVELTLDGTKSVDPDGEIETYRWLSGTVVPDAGTLPLSDDGGVTHRLYPAGEDSSWPDDVASPQVELTEGLWSFNLWVIDNRGALSPPDPLTITIGNAVDPAVAECAAAAVQTVPEACRNCICAIDDACRTAVTACNEDCWGLISCIGAMCPDFAAMAAMMDFSCVTTNCSAFLAGATQATPTGPCVRMCPEECAAMPAM